VVRVYAVSLVHKGCWSFEHVLVSGQWTSENTFFYHYFRVLSVQGEGVLRFGLLVAGQQCSRLSSYSPLGP